VVARERPDARLLFIGGDNARHEPGQVPYVEHLRQRAGELGLTDRLIWTGYTSAADVSAHLQAADVVVLPFREGVSLRSGTLMAALSHGCAVVGTAPARPIPEIAQAFMPSRAGDPEDLHRALEASLVPATQQRLRAAARTAAAHFAWDTIAASHTALYRALCHSEAGM
jgi:glycosyltransferase involved in cell wall biosynthesis